MQQNQQEADNIHMDINTLAKSIVDQATGDGPTDKGPNPKAVQRGNSRSKALPPERRAEIAKLGADARWKQEKREK